MAALLSIFSFAPPAEGGSLTSDERAAAVAYLEETRDAFVSLVRELDDEQFQFRQSADRWSIAEIAEHLVKVEGVVQEGLTKKLSTSSAHPEWLNDGTPLLRDHVIRMAVTNRVARQFTAPDFVAPGGGFDSREEAIAAFSAARNGTIDMIKKASPDLRQRFMENPALGMLDGYQWFLFVAAHSERHTLQAEEVRASARFPGRLTPISAEERAALVEDLHRSRDRIDTLVGTLSDRQLRFKPSPERWSIGEVVEHLARAEQTLLGLVRNTIAKEEPHPEWKGTNGPRVKDLVFVMGITNRERQRFQAPEPLKPSDEFGSPKAALSAFRERREETVAYALTVQDDLRAWFRDNPGFGSMDAYQWLLLLSAHTDRHAQQIEEVLAAAEFPK